MDIAHRILAGTGRAIVGACAWSWRYFVISLGLLATFSLWSLRLVWGGSKRTGRIALWVLFFPLGIWRSVRHGAKKDRRALETAIGRIEARSR